MSVSVLNLLAEMERCCPRSEPIVEISRTSLVGDAIKLRWWFKVTKDGNPVSMHVYVTQSEWEEGWKHLTPVLEGAYDAMQEANQRIQEEETDEIDGSREHAD